MEKQFIEHFLLLHRLDTDSIHVTIFIILSNRKNLNIFKNEDTNHDGYLYSSLE